MKLSFTIRHWPGMDWAQLCAAAADSRLAGLEIDSVYNPVLSQRMSPVNPELAVAARRELVRQGLEVPCVGVEADLTAEEAAAETAAALEAAANLLVPYVVVHTASSDSAAVREKLAPLVEAAERAGVVLLLESSGGMADTRRLVEVLDHFACDNLAACWCMFDTCLCAKESPQQTITNLGAYVRHVRVSDGSAGSRSPEVGHELIGEGDLPLQALMDALRSVNYDGFLSLQWDPQWSEGYGDLEMILTHFAVTMSAYAREARRQNLYYSQTGEGQYVWKKDIVIDCTFPQVLDRMVEEFPDQYCFKYTTLDYTRTYSQFRDDVDQFARSPHRHGGEGRGQGGRVGHQRARRGSSPSGPPPRSAPCW